MQYVVTDDDGNTLTIARNGATYVIAIQETNGAIATIQFDQQDWDRLAARIDAI